MTDPIYLPRNRSYRGPMMYLPHPADAHRLRIEGDSLICQDLPVANLSVLKLNNSAPAEQALLDLLADCLAHGYRCATADLRRFMDHGKNDHG